MIALESVKSEKNLEDSLTKGLSGKFVYDTLRGMGLKPIEWITHDSNPTYVIEDSMN